MLLQMAEAGLQPHDSAYNSTMAALVNGSKYEAALELLQRMQVSSVCVCVYVCTHNELFAQ